MIKHKLTCENMSNCEQKALCLCLHLISTISSYIINYNYKIYIFHCKQCHCSKIVLEFSSLIDKVFQTYISGSLASVTKAGTTRAATKLSFTPLISNYKTYTKIQTIISYTNKIYHMLISQKCNIFFHYVCLLVHTFKMIMRRDVCKLLKILLN